MSFFDDMKTIWKKIWEKTKPSLWEVFQYALALVVAYASQIVAGKLTKAEAREQGVQAIQQEFASLNPGLFSENKARLALELAVAWYKVIGPDAAEEAIKYTNETDFMEWYSSRPDK